MTEIVNEIPKKKATMIEIPKCRPRILGEHPGYYVMYPDFIVPRSLTRKLFAKCGLRADDVDRLSPNTIAQWIARANKATDMYLRIADRKPLNVVTGKFSEIDLAAVAENVGAVMGVSPIVRYSRTNEKVHLNFPLSNSFHNLNMFVDSGQHGVYGGSGDSAARFGISWYNGVCSNWTLFLTEHMQQESGRMIHLHGKKLKERLEGLVESAAGVDQSITESRDKTFTRDELDAYIGLYEQRGLGKRFTKDLRTTLKDKTSAYDISCRLTTLCQQWSTDTTRERVEYMAGELILCYDRLKQEMQQPRAA